MKRSLSRASLAAFLLTLATQSSAFAQSEGRPFGRIPLPKWQIIQAAFEHGIWTLGQTVPYVRLQGGTPHSYGIVPTN